MTDRCMYVPSKFFLGMFVSIRSFSNYSATADDITAAFDEMVWAYQCVACSGFFLKQSTGISLRREGARQSAADTPQQRIASLPVSRCRRDVAYLCYQLAISHG